MDDFRVPPVLEDHAPENGITVYLKVNYKVILLVVVILDIVHVSLREIVVRILGV